jgi:acyl phosphate:glycerol-3-phosphate acyltransferase
MTAIGSSLMIIATYLLGAIPWGVVLGRVIKGIDVRSYGSGGTGATNSLRVLGWPISISVFVLDFAKGLVPVILARWIDLPDWAIALTAVAAVAGHCWSPYIKLRGGKGMATGGGAAVGLLPWLFALLLLVVAIVYITRYVSLASLITALVGPAIAVALAIWGDFPGWWAAAIVGIAAIIYVQHRGNINRLLHGSERKFGGRESPTGTSA